ncbi:CC-NBS-LRR resistance protein, putative [Medicago truncatula]|uniref:CC-NBS-LRR resistance protein, putative n=1 Tax=Medicago truncatula TaxID=3880 RepID=G7ZWR3_MEDTR|nr:CC-NBS-LRR resistance protein, putative [Medicago truncatula]
MWFKNELNCLPSIHKMTFTWCSHLKALPDWICNISSLQRIEMKSCYNLALLPDGMTRLTNLHTLEINSCPLLIEECQTKTSATWSKIDHIPNIGSSYGT